MRLRAQPRDRSGLGLVLIFAALVVADIVLSYMTTAQYAKLKTQVDALELHVSQVSRDLGKLQREQIK